MNDFNELKELINDVLVPLRSSEDYMHLFKNVSIYHIMNNLLEFSEHLIYIDYYSPSNKTDDMHVLILKDKDRDIYVKISRDDEYKEIILENIKIVKKQIKEMIIYE